MRLVLVGGGPEEQRLRVLLPNAAFLGVLHGAELSEAYASLDVFVHTGRHETYCQSAQEALASGVPAVAPRAGGPVDVIDDGVAGFLYTPGDATELASFVMRLVEDPLLRLRMSRSARRSVEGRSWHSVNELLVRHYREVSGVGVRRRRQGLLKRAAASSIVSTRCTCGSIARPRASDCSSGHAGSARVQ